MSADIGYEHQSIGTNLIGVGILKAGIFISSTWLSFNSQPPLLDITILVMGILNTIDQFLE